MTPNIFLLNKSVSTLFTAISIFSCSVRLTFFNSNLMRLVVSYVTALARLFNSSAMCDSSPWGLSIVSFSMNPMCVLLS